MSFKNEKIVETKKCEKTGVLFDITDKDLEFYDKISPVFNGKKYSIPTPKLCPEARQQRRLSFRNERNLYRRKCDLSGEDIISIYSPDKPYKVFSQDIWWSDKWNATDYGKDFDFSRPFSEQFYELFKQVPIITLISDNGLTSENCEYCQDFADGKNCYFAFETGGAEDCYFIHHCDYSKNTLDSSGVFNSQNCYESCDSNNLYGCKYLFHCQNCSNCSFGEDMDNCSECFGCIGLKNKKYYIFNKEYSKEEYFNRKQELEKKPLKEIFNLFDSIKSKYPKKYANLIKTTDSLGNDIFSSKNTLGFAVINCQDSKNIYFAYDMKSCYDCSGWFKELCYNCLTCDKSFKAVFSAWCWSTKFCYYSSSCHNSSNLFGCVGLKNKEYCILNKQYTKEEYEELVPKIIEHMQKNGEWGEFFPASISPFGYNETVAQEYFPLTKEEATK